mgnify:CR=1 FL=1
MCPTQQTSIAATRDLLRGASPSDVCGGPGPVVAILLALVAIATAGTHPATAQGLPDRCHCGYLAVRGDAVIAEQASDRLYTPASVQKVLVATAAMHLLGPEYRVATVVRGPQPDDDGRVRGDLTIVGRGDPTWNRNHFERDPRTPLEQLAEALWQRGVRRVQGDLVIDGTAFPGRETPPDWPVGDLSFRYGAVPSALAIDANTVPLSMRPGRRVGDPAIVSTTAPIELYNLAVTAPAQRHGKGTVEFQLRWDRAAIVVRGEFPISEPAFDIRVAAPRPLQLFADAMAEALRRRGIDLDGAVRILDLNQAAAQTADEIVLARLISPAAVEWLEPLLADSDNWYAEMMLRVLGLEIAGAGRLDAGLEVLGDFLVDVVGVDEADFDLDDGSGLSPFNLLAPRAVVSVLRWARQQEWFAGFEVALASDRQGTLSRSWGAVPRLRAKTGSLTHVQTLAGYDYSISGEPIVFAVFSNGRAVPRHEMKRDILAELRRWNQIVTTLDAGVAAGGTTR